MIYDFSGVDKVHLNMDERNENMICRCYKDGKIMKEVNMVCDYKPFQIYSFLNAINNFGVKIFIGSSENKLEEDLEFDEETEDSKLLKFCQH